MKVVSLILSLALVFVFEITKPACLATANEQVVEVRVQSETGGHSATNDSSQANTDSKGSSETRKVKGNILGLEKYNAVGDVKFVIGGGDAREEIVQKVEKHLKDAGVKKEVIEQVRKALKDRHSDEQGFWYSYNDHKVAPIKSYSTAILEWPADKLQHFMIGLSSSAVGESLRSHFGFDKGGLIVDAVVDDSPADQAGLKKHDIIIKADDSLLADQQTLVAAVQAAGKEDEELVLSIIRRGDAKTIKVKPTKRKAVRLEVENLRNAKVAVRPHVDYRYVETPATPERVRLQSVGPAYMIARDYLKPNPRPQNLEREIRKLSGQIESLNKVIKALADRLPEK